MCTCELSLSHADPDVNRGPLMSKEVDKQAFIAPPPPTPTPFYLGLSSANGLYSINQLVCNFEGQLSSDGSLVFSASSFFFSIPLVWGFGCEPGRAAVRCHNKSIEGKLHSKLMGIFFICAVLQNPATHLCILDGSDMLPYVLMILWVTLKTQFSNSETRQRWPENKAIDNLETHFHLTTMGWSFIPFQLKITHRLDVLRGKHVMSSYKNRTWR